MPYPRERPAPDTILSSPRKTCGSVTGGAAASNIDLNRCSPDVLPSASQITGQSSQPPSLTSILNPPGSLSGRSSQQSQTDHDGHLMTSVSHHNVHLDHEDGHHHGRQAFGVVIHVKSREEHWPAASHEGSVHDSHANKAEEYEVMPPVQHAHENPHFGMEGGHAAETVGPMWV